MNLNHYLEKRRFERIYNADYLIKPQDPPVLGLIEALCLEPDSVVIEFGSGEGHFTLPIARKLKELRSSGLIFGFEFAEWMIEHLNEAAIELDLEQQVRSWPITRLQPNILPIKDDKADRILAVNSIHYLDSPLAFYEEFARILKPGGILLIADWIRHPAGEKGTDKLQSGLLENAFDHLFAIGLGIPEELSIEVYSWVVRAKKPEITN